MGPERRNAAAGAARPTGQQAGSRAVSADAAFVVTPTGSGTTVGPRYKWIVLSNTTIGVLLASVNGTSLMIALPVIFRGVKLNPLLPSNFPYLLWILMGYLLVSAAIVEPVGRIGDMFGRVKMYNLGFAWFTGSAVLLSLVWSKGSAGALELIVLRMVQAIGGALLMANSAAIITDAFPSEQLGLALGTNMIAGILGSFLGIIAGGLLSQVGWRWVFLVNVPIGGFATIWAYLKLREIGIRIPAKLDWAGNVSFAGGLVLILIGITYSLEPYGGALTGWGSPFVLAMVAGGMALLGVFLYVETKVKAPMFRLALFRIRPFWAGNLAQFLGAVGRGGFQFMLMIWFQGIWLPAHGYAFTVTPLWAGIYLIPFMLGFVVTGPISGLLSDRFGARPFATAGMVVSAASFGVLIAFPALFSYWPFAAVLFVSGIGNGLFASPNTASIMNSVPARHRGAASGMRVTFSSAGMPLSMGLFFTILVLGLNADIPHALLTGLVAHGVPHAVAVRLSKSPPLGYLFAAFLGYNPLKTLLGSAVLAKLPAHQAALLTSRAFFPALIGAPFKHALGLILIFAIVMSLIAAIASALRGARYVHEDEESLVQKAAVLSGPSAPGTGSSPMVPREDSGPEHNGDDGAATGDGTREQDARTARRHGGPVWHGRGARTPT